MRLIFGIYIRNKPETTLMGETKRIQQILSWLKCSRKHASVTESSLNQVMNLQQKKCKAVYFWHTESSGFYKCEKNMQSIECLNFK